MQYPQSSSGFFITLLMIRGRALDWMLWPWVLVTLHAVVYTLVKELAFENGDQRENSAWEINDSESLLVSHETSWTILMVSQ